jgi:hypothetical protein
MVTRALLLLLLTSGCFDDRYRCTSDAQCDLGVDGRCETDGYCSARDITCPTQRRYGAHAGALAEQCVDDRAVPANLCAGGQLPAKPDGCLAAVCEWLPACCDIGWFDACVPLAQQACEHTCDLRLAITAERGGTTELWDVRFSDTWTFAQRTDLAKMSWVGPPPGAREPRLAGVTEQHVVIGETMLDLLPGRTYSSISAIGFDRDRRDTVVATFSTDMGNRSEVYKLDTFDVAEAPIPGGAAIAWGDINRDGFPDAIVKNGNQQFNFLHNLEDDELNRRLSNQAGQSVAGGATPGAPPLRSFDWIDLNSDGKLDLAVFGAEVRIHMNPLGLGDAASRQIDCDPPAAGRPCQNDPNEPNLEKASFAGAAMPTTPPALVIAQYPHRRMFFVRPDGAVEPLRFPGDGCSCTANCTGTCPGPQCNCTSYNCSACVPVIAVVVRDVDHDRALDIIAIDARLQIYVATAANEYEFDAPVAIPTSFTNLVVSIEVSVTGAPSP